VPAPPGSAHPSWAEHFKAPMADALHEMGIEFHPVSQTAMYTSGAYREQILLAMRERDRIDAVLDRYRTKNRDAEAAAATRAAADPDDEATERPDALDAAEDERGAAGYFPYRPYCSVCGRDTTTVTRYDDATTELAYTCACGHGETVLLAGFNRGKLVWKVDWPMRWAYEGVVFEPSGVDHSSPGSSFQVGGQIVTEVFGGVQPIGPMYAFVGISGMAKMSSSRGGVPTPAEALELMEAPLLRWLYARRRPNQAFKISFDQEMQRVYDEWDALSARVAAGAANPADATAYDRAVRTAAGPLPVTPHPLPYRTLASIVDVTTGDPAQTLRILRELDPRDPVASLDEARPRLDRAQRWITTQVPAEQRTHVRDTPDRELLDALGPDERESLRLLLAGLDAHWSLEALTTLVYGVPKTRLGLPPDVAPSPELKVAQREFFALLYRLLVGRDTGPRLPTLLLAIGRDRVRTLLAT
jgi:lysyl-tRNA synthetase class 1